MNKLHERNRTPLIPSAPPQNHMGGVMNAPPPSYEELYHQPPAIQDFPPKYSTIDRAKTSVNRSRKQGSCSRESCSRKSCSRSDPKIRDDNCSVHDFLLSPLHEIEANSIPALTESDIKKAFRDLHHHHQNRLKKKRSNNFKMIEWRKYSMWKYEIESIVESRHCFKNEKPFCGGVESKKHHKHTSVWDLKVGISDDFKTQHFKLPGSSSVTDCGSCLGRRTASCSSCSGEGTVACECCWGSGNQAVTHTTHQCGRNTSSYSYQTSESCNNCGGKGKSRCSRCHGYARVPCLPCNETGKKETFKQVRVEWEKKRNHYYTDDYQFSRSFLAKCEGLTLYQDVCAKGNLSPILPNQCIQPDMVNCSHTYVKEHKCVGEASRVVHQKHSVSIIPVYEVTYEDRNRKVKTFSLVGTNKHLLEKSHPRTNNCTIS